MLGAENVKLPITRGHMCVIGCRFSVLRNRHGRNIRTVRLSALCLREPISLLIGSFVGQKLVRSRHVNKDKSISVRSISTITSINTIQSICNKDETMR